MSTQRKKVAIVLFNLGGPDSLKAVKPFLFNLFYDPLIIRLPNPFRWILAKYVSIKRAPFTKKIYGALGGKTPLLEETIHQGEVLKNKLYDLGDVKSFIVMRYWHPFAKETIKEVIDFDPEELILLPLYPQYSTTTTKSSFKDWEKVAKKANLKAKVFKVENYYKSPLFIEAHIEKILPQLKKSIKNGPTQLLFSAHGLPQKIVDSGDPYVDQIHEGAELVAHGLRDVLPGFDFNWTVCFQSRVGRLEWVKPYTTNEIRRAGRKKKNIVIVPFAFVSEHSETLVELDIEYQELAMEKGAPNYERVKTLSVNDTFMQCLAEEIRNRVVPSFMLEEPKTRQVEQSNHEALAEEIVKNITRKAEKNTNNNSGENND